MATEIRFRDQNEFCRTVRVPQYANSCFVHAHTRHFIAFILLFDFFHFFLTEIKILQFINN